MLMAQSEVGITGELPMGGKSRGAANLGLPLDNSRQLPYPGISFPVHEGQMARPWLLVHGLRAMLLLLARYGWHSYSLDQTTSEVCQLLLQFVSEHS